MFYIIALFLGSWIWLNDYLVNKRIDNIKKSLIELIMDNNNTLLKIKPIKKKTKKFKSK